MRRPRPNFVSAKYPNMNSVVTERFIQCFQKLKADKKIASGRQFALTLEYLPQSLSEILKGRRDVTIEVVRKAVERFRFNPRFLFDGTGPMFAGEGEDLFRVLTVVADKAQHERIVHVPVPAQAGYADEMMEPTYVQELPTFSLPDYQFNTGTYRSFDVTGESMEPVLFSDDKVVGRFLEPGHWLNSLKENGMYIFVTRGDVVVKRVKPTEDPHIFELHSDNPDFDPYIIRLKDVKEIWKVCVKISPRLSAPRMRHHGMESEIALLKQVIERQESTISKLSNHMEVYMAMQQKSEA